MEKKYIIASVLAIASIAGLLWYQRRKRQSAKKCEGDSCPLTTESFAELDRKPKPGPDIQVGNLPNAPGPVKDMMADLNKIGGQLVADSEYDQVPTEVLTQAAK